MKTFTIYFTTYDSWLKCCFSGACCEEVNAENLDEALEFIRDYIAESGDNPDIFVYGIYHNHCLVRI